MVVSPEGGSGELSRETVQGRVPHSAESPAITTTSREHSGSLRSSRRAKPRNRESGGWNGESGEGVADGVELER